MQTLRDARNRFHLLEVLCDEMLSTFQAERVAVLEWASGAPMVLAGRGLEGRMKEPDAQACVRAVHDAWHRDRGALDQNWVEVKPSATTPPWYPIRLILTCPVELTERRLLLYADRRIIQGLYGPEQVPLLEELARNFAEVWVDKPGYPSLPARVHWGLQRYFEESSGRRPLQQRLLEKLQELFKAERAALFRKSSLGLELVEGLEIGQEQLALESFQSTRNLLELAIEEGRGPNLTSSLGDPRFIPHRDSVPSGLRSVLCIGIRDRHGQIGALYLDRRLRQDYFDRLAFADLEKIAELAVGCGLSLAPPFE